MNARSRGRLLLQQGRYEEAEAEFRRLIARDPEDGGLFAELARSLLPQPGRRKEALEAIDRALELEPDSAGIHAQRSLVLSRLERDRAALEAAERAVALDPGDDFHHVVRAQALAGLHRWPEAEAACRRALELRPDHAPAANLLAHVLRVQGRQGEGREAADRLLAEDPEDAFAHFNAAWAALQGRDHLAAERHFREALRLDPEFEPARQGLLQSFKARSRFYRAYLRFAFFMQRFTRAAQWGIVIGLLLAFHFGRFLLHQVHPLAGLAVVIVYLAFVLWVLLAGGIGNFLILLNRSARHALRRGEAWQGALVGGGLLGGIVICGIAALAGSLPVAVLGAAWILAAIPASLAFANPSRKGRRLFGALFLLIHGVGLGVCLAESIRQPAETLAPASSVLVVLALFAGVLSTWLGNLPALRRDDSG